MFLETDNPDVKSVVRLLSSALGIDASKAANYVSPKKESLWVCLISVR